MEDYREVAPAHQIYRFCPLCATTLRNDLDQVNGFLRPTCPGCGWIYYPANLYGGLAVIEIPNIADVAATANVAVPDGASGPGIVLIMPPGCPPDAPAALPGGIAEYAETPEECVVREVREETGLHVEITEELDRWLFVGGLGPMLHFGFTARIVGGAPHRDGDEGPAGFYPLASMPAVSADRAGSRRVLDAYLERRAGLPR